MHLSLYFTIAITLFAISNSCTASETKTGTIGQVAMVESVIKGTPGKAVNFVWKDGNRTVTFAEYTAGKVVLLNLWATWCPPCRREIPDLIEIAKEYEHKGVVVIGVSLDEGENNLALVKKFVERNKIPYLNVIDNMDHVIASSYGNISSIPTTFIIDKQGNVVKRIIGMQSKAAFVAALSKYF